MAAQRTKVDYVNRALALLAEDEINELTADESRQSAIATQLYDSIKETLLARHGWGFALRTLDASQITGDPPPPWLFRYTYPADCLRLWASGSADEAYAVRVDPVLDKTVIFTNRPELVLTYIYNAPENQFTAAFQTALVMQLAYKLAMPITRQKDLADYYKQEAETEFARAAAEDWSQSSAPTLGDDGNLFTSRQL